MRCLSAKPWIALAVMALVVLSAQAMAAGTYRWVDEDGDVHYSDNPPSSVVDGDPAHIDANGMVHHDQPKADADHSSQDKATSEETAATEPETKRSRRDRVLRKKYDSVAGLERTRDRRLKGIDGQRSLARDRVRSARSRMERAGSALAKMADDSGSHADARARYQGARERLDDRRQEYRALDLRYRQTRQRFQQELTRLRELKE